MYKIWDLDWGSFLWREGLCKSNCPSTTYWKECSSNFRIASAPLSKTIWAYLCGSISGPAALFHSTLCFSFCQHHSLDYCSFIILVYEVWYLHYCFLKHILAILVLLLFHISLRQLVFINKKSCWNFSWNCIKFIILRTIDTFIMKVSSYYEESSSPWTRYVSSFILVFFFH